MADQKYQRSYRTGDNNKPDSDPLAELARLIGQSDPFAEFGRKEPRPQDRWQEDRRSREASAEGAPNDAHAPDMRVGRGLDASGYPAQYSEEQYSEEPHLAHDRAEEGYSEESYADDGYSDRGYPQQAGADEDEHLAQSRSEAGYPGAGHAERGSAYGAGAEYADEAAAYDDRRLPAHLHPADQRAFAAYDQEQEHDDQGYGSGPPWADEPVEEEYAHAPPRRRRGGLLTVMAVLGLAFMGTAGAFTYRALIGGTGNKPPPIIKASTAPTKIVPATQTADSSKSIDRVGDHAQNERIVPHEEQPVNVDEAALPSAPRSVLPDPAAPTDVPSSGPALPAAAAAVALPSGMAGSVDIPPNSASAAPANPSEPKKVRTVSIRPEGAQNARSGAPARTASAAAAASDATMPRSTGPATRSAAPAPVANNGPLSLAPGEAASSTAGRTRAPAAPPPSTRTASLPTGGQGGYAVQVSSQRSEADAQASFRSLKQKYAAVFGNREPIIRRVDLPEKGVYYRTFVGGFATAEEAGQFCNSLKAAGGQCFIQRN